MNGIIGKSIIDNIQAFESLLQKNDNFGTDFSAITWKLMKKVKSFYHKDNTEINENYDKISTKVWTSYVS